MTNELNPMDLKTSSAYLEYILQSEGELLWMHFDEAQRIESAGKDEAFDDGYSSGFREALYLMQDHLKLAIKKVNEVDNEQ